jgi:hypothetical protein
MGVFYLLNSNNEDFMAFAVNDLLQTAAEELNITDEPLSGDRAAKCESCLNRAITMLNSSGFMSMSVNTLDRVATGIVLFKKLEEGEQPSGNIVDMEPPDTVTGVSRKVGIRWLRLRPSNVQMQDRTNTYSYATTWTYGTTTEVAPSGQTRRVGELRMNGTYPTEVRIYLNSQLPQYKMGDNVYLSSLYYGLVLAQTKERMVDRFKLYSYAESVNTELLAAKKAIDTNTANNRPEDTGVTEGGSYLDGYYDLLGGNGF